MSRAQEHAYVLYLRTCAQALQSGDDKARVQAAKLIAQADEIDKKEANHA